MATGNSRNKVALKPGFSQMHWMMKVQSDSSLSGRNGKPPRRIPMSEVELHATEDDAWTVFRGRVFNITPYLHFHPGGVEILMEGAGRDCTELFNQYHQWVNAEGMIGALYLGDLDNSAPNLTAAKRPKQTSLFSRATAAVASTAPASASSASSMPPPTVKTKQITKPVEVKAQKQPSTPTGPPYRPHSPTSPAPVAKPTSLAPAPPPGAAAVGVVTANSGGSNGGGDGGGGFDGFVAVALSSALQGDNARLLVCVPSALQEAANTPKAAAASSAISSSGGGGSGSGRYVALVRWGGKVSAMDATCYHMGGPMLLADLEECVADPLKNMNENKNAGEGGKGGEHGGGGGGDACLTCPWHHYRIRLRDGRRMHEVLVKEEGSSGVTTRKGWEASEEPRQRVHEVEERSDGQVWVRLSEESDVPSDAYAFKKPAPPQRGSKAASGGRRLLGGRGRSSNGGRSGGKGASGSGASSSSGASTKVGEAVVASMKGGDGVAPWALSPSPSTKATKAMGPPLGLPPRREASRANASVVNSLSSLSLSALEWTLFPVVKVAPAGRDMVLLTFECSEETAALLSSSGSHVDVCAEVPTLTAVAAAATAAAAAKNGEATKDKGEKDEKDHSDSDEEGSDDDVFGLPSGESRKEEEEGELEEVVRPYTPFVRLRPNPKLTTAAAAAATFELLVKGYHPFGRLSVLLASATPADSSSSSPKPSPSSVAMRGPMGGIASDWLLRRQPTTSPSVSSVGTVITGGEGKKGVHLVLVGAGTGVTPMLQLLFASLEAHQNQQLPGNQFSAVSAVTLLTCNHLEADIPMQLELDQLHNTSSAFPPSTLSVRVLHALSSSTHSPASASSLVGSDTPPSSSSLYLSGRVSADMLRPLLAHPQASSSTVGGTTDGSKERGGLGELPVSEGVRLAWCGPDGFMKTMRAVATELRVPPDYCHEFS